MTNEEKLEAILRGETGSYNIAPKNGSKPEISAFQPVAREAHRIAMTRRYFCKAESFAEGCEPQYSGILVTITKSSTLGPAL
jgi:hypothetical protein